jgi:hypothetical protein
MWNCGWMAALHASLMCGFMEKWLAIGSVVLDGCSFSGTRLELSIGLENIRSIGQFTYWEIRVRTILLLR